MLLNQIKSISVLAWLAIGALGTSAVCQENTSLQAAKEHYARAKQFTASGAQDRALSELKLAIQLAPEFVEAHRDYQDSQRSKTDSLIQEYDSYARQNPKSAAFRYLLGRAYSLAGRRNEADVEYQNALKLDPYFSWALLSTGSAARGRGETSQAADAWQKARLKAGASPTLHYLLASNLLLLKKYDSALEESVTALRMDPALYAAYPIKWRSKINLSDSEEVLAAISGEIQQLESGHPQDINALEAILKGYEIVIDKSGRARARDALLAADPKYFEKQQYPRVYTITSGGQPIEFAGPNARRFVDAKEFSNAKQRLDVLRDVEKEVADADIRFYLIYPEIFKSYVDVGDFANAEGIMGTLEKGGMSSFRLADSRIDLARSYLSHKAKLDEALQQVEKAEESLRERINQLGQKEKTEMAIGYARVSLARALHARGLILAAKGMTAKAVASFAESVKENEGEENTLDLGLSYIRAGKTEEGIKMLVSAYSFEGPRSQEAKKALVLAYGKREKTALLAGLLKEALNRRRLEVKKSTMSETSTLLPKNEARPAPMFELASISGRKVSLTEFKGKVVLLNFWATWCGPCLQEWPPLQKIYSERKEKGFALVMISIDEELYRVPLFLKKNPSQAQMLFSDGLVTRVYEEHGIPLLVLVDRNGMIRYRRTGFEVKDEGTLQQLIDSLLNEE